MAFNPFSSGANEANRLRMKNSRRGASFLTAGAISNTARGLIRERGDEFVALAEGAQVAGEIDSATIAQRMSEQGLAGTGLGAGIAGGLRSGNTFRANQLRAALTSEIYGQALQANTAAGQMIANTFIEAEPAAFGTALNAIGTAAFGVGALGNLRQ